MNNPELGPVILSKGKAFVRRTRGRTQRGNMNISESSGAGEVRRTCPFYKRIPGKLEYQLQLIKEDTAVPNVTGFFFLSLISLK